jgi:NTE family protein
MPDFLPYRHPEAPSDLTPPQPLPVTIALEGGGSLGAFAWGVLDRLLDVPDLRIEAVSGASAGAMNAAMLVQGLANGGPERARYLLDVLWRRVAMASGSPDLDMARWAPGLVNMFMGPAIDAVRRAALLHYQPSPLLPNPLRFVLDGLLDSSVFGRDGAPMLVVSATSVRTGEARMFVDEEITVDALLASACLPHVFPAVRIGGEAYWDGAYASNPPLRPLIEAGAPSDIIVIRSTALERPDVPVQPSRIIDRVSELACGGALRQELRSLAIAQRMLPEVPDLPMGGVLARLRDARVHMIGDDHTFRSLHGGSELDPSWGFLAQMREAGHAAAERWLASNLPALGRHSSFDLAALAPDGIRPRATRADSVRPLEARPWLQGAA